MSYYEQCHYYEEHADNFSGCPKRAEECKRCPWYKWVDAKWNPVEAGLPPYRKHVAVLTVSEVPHVAKLVPMSGMNVWVSSSSTQYGEKIITHWCDCIPALPN